MRTRLVIAVLVAAFVATAACSKEKKGPTSRDGVVAAWKKGGLSPAPLTAAKTDIGSDCATGTVDKLDVLVCTFKSEKEAKDAEDKALAWVGDNTGAAKAHGPVLIVVADRKKADPSGKIINQLITLPAE